jgi:hypothetical protein
VHAGLYVVVRSAKDQQKPSRVEIWKMDEVGLATPSSVSETFPQRTLSKCDIVPDVKELTLKNLDTGEEYIIGENDPDFEFDTFALTGDGDGMLFMLLYSN